MLVNLVVMPILGKLLLVKTLLVVARMLPIGRQLLSQISVIMLKILMFWANSEDTSGCGKNVAHWPAILVFFARGERTERQEEKLKDERKFDFTQNHLSKRSLHFPSSLFPFPTSFMTVAKITSLVLPIGSLIKWGLNL